MQAYESIMYGHFCIGFIDFMLTGKTLQYYTNLVSSNKYEKNDKIILKYSQLLKRVRWKKVYCIICIKYRKFKKPKITYIFEKTLVLFIICIKCKHEDEKKVLKNKNQLTYWKFLVYLEVYYNYFKICLKKI